MFKAASWFIILPVLISIFRFKKFTGPIWYIVAYVFVSFVIERITRYLGEKAMNNIVFFNLYPVVEFILITMYLKTLNTSVGLKRLITCLQSGFLIFSLVNLCFIQGLWKFNSYTRGLEALVIITLVVFSFFNDLKNTGPSFSLWSSDSWLRAGFLIFFSGTLLLFVLNNYLESNTLYIYKLGWLSHAVLSMVMYSFISIGLWKHKTK